MSFIFFLFSFSCFLYPPWVHSADYLYPLWVYSYSVWFFEVFIHVFFHLINHCYHSFQLKIWDFIPFTIIEIIAEWLNFSRCHITILFHISYACTSRFAPLKSIQWLRGFVSWSLEKSVEFFSMFWWDQVMAGLFCCFLILAWGYNLEITNSPKSPSIPS
jgi:hypothetical protein